MATNVPVVTFGALGFQAPSGPAVLAGVQADINAAFGTTLSYNLNTPQGQLASSMAALVVNTNSIFVYYTNQVDPAFASGRMQDAIGRIYFMDREGSEPTVLQVLCFGLEGVVIPDDGTGIVVDPSGNLYVCTDAATIPSTGNVTTQFAAKVPGPTAVPTSLSIYQAVPGWDSASVVSGVVGRDTETRAEFEARRQATVALNSVGSVPSIKAAVLDVPGVLDAYVTDNDTGAPVVVGGVTLAAHSVYVAAVGGTSADVAKAIWTKKMPGCAMNGNTTVTVYDDNSGYVAPLPSYQITFQRPSNLAILFNVVIANGPLIPTGYVAQVQAALLAAFEGEDGGPAAKIGAVLYALRYAAPVAALGPWAQVTTLGIGSNNAASAVIRGRIAGTALTVDSVVSGAIAVGQTLSDAFGHILPGTRITAGAGSSWTVNNAHTLGATFTGTGSGTNLTASAVTGLISAGDVVSGTGVPANTTIVSQTSGTTGGAGVYVTSAATTSAAASLKSSDAITSAVASASLVSVQIDQEPTLTANNIVVSTT